jgi:hypothetical protein
MEGTAVKKWHKRKNTAAGICLTTEEKARKTLSYENITYITSRRYNTRTMNSKMHRRKTVTQSSKNVREQ